MAVPDPVPVISMVLPRPVPYVHTPEIVVAPKDILLELILGDDRSALDASKHQEPQDTTLSVADDTNLSLHHAQTSSAIVKSKEMDSDLSILLAPGSVQEIYQRFTAIFSLILQYVFGVFS
ncbi:hypothetical protein MVEN_00895100 [Mycena venus]|uniref:Uncharacterized protein n=1 Tax=Mycena venus TaxID=2733690 RepID=A0A8H6YHM0_9AGAR|nr:hypothetical protein MVEN_00895100 [Mycena venus]